MKKIELTAFDFAQRFTKIKEVQGTMDNPFILAMLRLDEDWPEHDEVPWCSAFANFVCWMLRLPRSKSLRARSWLLVGEAVTVSSEAQVGFDVVILKRGGANQPGPEVIQAQGHVGFFAGLNSNHVAVLGGNQANSVNTSFFDVNRILGIRRLYS